MYNLVYFFVKYLTTCIITQANHKASSLIFFDDMRGYPKIICPHENLTDYHQDQQQRQIYPMVYYQPCLQ